MQDESDQDESDQDMQIQDESDQDDKQSQDESDQDDYDDQSDSSDSSDSDFTIDPDEDEDEPVTDVSWIRNPYRNYYSKEIKLYYSLARSKNEDKVKFVEEEPDIKDVKKMKLFKLQPLKIPICRDKELDTYDFKIKTSSFLDESSVESMSKKKIQMKDFTLNASHIFNTQFKNKHISDAAISEAKENFGKILMESYLKLNILLKDSIVAKQNNLGPKYSDEKDDSQTDDTTHTVPHTKNELIDSLRKMTDSEFKHFVEQHQLFK
ncbi:hypothetical protein MRV_0110 [Murid herpesvirus 3]|nr:hypothetical protein MRV_0110 [Murine roseolovirus]APZ76321.1 hypothetical protein MRV_0110 [Murid betaherpesvirus 3]AYH64773.1 hypothetical protein MRV_0110 [Murid herpesvirus 3]